VRLTPVPSNESRSSAPAPLVSVVVPTRDRPTPLSRCLAALAAQTVSDVLEVIVVDDGSDDPAPIVAVTREHRFARLIRVQHRGPAAARNAGAAIARGGCLCFTDDDCEPAAGWAEALANAIEGGADAAAGRTLSPDPGSVIAAAAEVVAEAPAAVPASLPGALSFAPTNNLACRADVLAAVPFDERYPAAAGEDRDWCARLGAAGYLLRGEPSAELIHRPNETLRAFIGQQVRYGRGAYRFRTWGADRGFEPPAFYARLIRRGFDRGARAGVLVCVAQVAAAIGYISEWRASRAPTPKITANPFRDGRQGDEMVDDVKGQGGSGESRPAPAQEHAIERMVEHGD
jgi:glycosyltransferase involved in cell wall biosynthesis